MILKKRKRRVPVSVANQLAILEALDFYAKRDTEDADQIMLAQQQEDAERMQIEFREMTRATVRASYYKKRR